MSTPRDLALPAGVDALTVRTPRGDFAAHDARPDGVARGHILMIPGFTGSKEDFTPVLPLLAADGWHATAYDQRGQHETAGADDADYSLAGFAADATAVRDAVAASVRDAVAAPIRDAVASTAAPSHLVGHSFGGLVAQAAVLASPRTWASLTLLCSGPGGFTIDRQVKPLGSFVEAVPRFGLDAVFERMQAKKDPVPPDVRTWLYNRFTNNATASLLAIARHLVEAPDRVGELANAGVPVFVVHGADDTEWPPETQREMAQRLGRDVVVIPDSAHSPAVENPAATARVLTNLIGD